MPVGKLIIGTRPGEVGSTEKLVRLIRDLRGFMRRMVMERYAIVHVNPSLDTKSLVRDGMFVLMAKLCHKKTLVFFRGWNSRHEDLIQSRWLWLFKNVFGRADAFIVLSEAFRRRLITWVGDKPVYREFTVLDDEALLGFDFQRALEQRLQARPWRVLFMSRLLKEKGLYEAMTAIGLLARHTPAVELVVAGEGPELLPARKFAAEAGLSNIRFVGYVRGKAKNQLLKSAHMLCFPTTHGEGMPNAVLECMGFGLPVITRPVGGLADFLRNGVHGFVTESSHPQVYADFIRALMKDESLYRTMALNNYNFAQAHFKASQAACRLESIYKNIFNNGAEESQRALQARCG